MIYCIADPVTNVKYVPNKKVFKVGDTVNCTADGYPLPRFTWLAVRSPGGREVRSNVLKITENMIGDNEWKCTATSDYTTNPVIIIAKFTVGKSIAYVTILPFLLFTL